MSQSTQWNLFSNHACVLILLARHQNQPLREVAFAVGITERAVQRIVAELEEAGYLSRQRKGRRNVYRIDRELPLRHALLANCTVGQMLDLFNSQPLSEDSETDSILENWAVGEHGSEVK